MRPQHRAQQAQAIVERRRDLAALWLDGVRDQRALATRLQVHHTTVMRDLRVLQADWRAAAAQDTAAAMGEDLARLEVALLAIWPKVKAGQYQAIDRLVRLLERKARMLGYEAPTQAELDIRVLVAQIAPGAGLTDEEQTLAITEAERILGEMRRDQR